MAGINSAGKIIAGSRKDPKREQSIFFELSKVDGLTWKIQQADKTF